MSFPEFKEFKKIPRLNREIIITEKIDGTNGVVYISEDNQIYAGSRNRWLWGEEQEEIHNDNFGFANWVKTNKEELKQLGQGYHYGEWWGRGIQRGYNLQEKRFSLFNVGKWVDYRNIPCGQFPREYEEFYLKELKEKYNNDRLEYCPECCYVVPILYKGIFNEEQIILSLANLAIGGSIASLGFKDPEGIIIYHIAGKQYFKKTIKNDEKGKDENK